MKILALETSCDDTAVSIVEVKGSLARPGFRILAHNIASQTDTHQAWGGIVPSLAKREHGRNLLPILLKSLADAFGPTTIKPVKSEKTFSTAQTKKLNKLLEREPELREQFFKIIPTLKIPKIDLIAVTKGPGLEPALWVGINLAQVLALIWDKPLQAINHLEGHILAVLETAATGKAKPKIVFPVVSLIASGGHTELVLSKDWLKYQVIGRTRDDAAGEAFDKVARILGLPYPGGPAIAKLALKSPRTPLEWPPKGSPRGTRSSGRPPINLPRPMLKSGDFDFSFSGLKTAVLYLTQKLDREQKLDRGTKATIAAEFQNAVMEVLTAKTLMAAVKFKAKTIIAGGGVIANTSLREALARAAIEQNITLLIPDLAYTTDNATMIAIAAGLRSLTQTSPSRRTVLPRPKGQSSRSPRALKADGNWRLG
ncbi:MAG: tRNA (adenosine(37)-N6)-threonylcarbamoyltransferase complex transferase subunit TsaD [Candidatus Vogelbacteria bacterium CG10_big_fil_rev_8_21_14_0_10_49_38]|uniref:tRNA N6-adenosine threonylcarbamoyltransferase n=1 Tax=Candidatus Vogelbacteria bacterium CG10_big_fil_rev_8_21_14_0_10_49_38 TaxID=1975043 RepID=A0A2H0RH32_9BACT|nr:MAG: hypothetical protein BK006_03035 [bacterium CG10_49_38]PIR45813.1 MAG: tRNA (adenosine(37)-N6)-threonylcarbamoyltransferase complex transferase subunit TsaD [Candidatus Vogelbacteria bacterium CG10_big_fil_rev_8_21_14_0_10_49_38]